MLTVDRLAFVDREHIWGQYAKVYKIQWGLKSPASSNAEHVAIWWRHHVTTYDE